MTRVSRTEILVRLAGIEPTTPWFVAKYSIQLSYSREASDYSMVSLDSARPFRAWRDNASDMPRKEKQPGNLRFRAVFLEPKFWCGWQESNPRPLGS